MFRQPIYLSLLAALLLPLGLPAHAETPPPPHLGYGMMLTVLPQHLLLVEEAGFDWRKYFVYWNDVDYNRDRIYDWSTVNWRLDEACAQEGVNLLLRVHVVEQIYRAYLPLIQRAH